MKTPSSDARSTPAFLHPGPFLAVLAIFATAWAGHTLEYARVFGAAGLQGGLTGSVHGYMVPVALLLLAIAFATGGWLYRRWQRLGHRLAAVEAAIAAAWRGDRPELGDRTGQPPLRSAGVALWVLLAPVELAVYLIQENFEALRVGLPPVGLAPVLGVHWAASLIHLGLLLAAAIVVSLAAAKLVRRAATVADAEALLRAIVARQRPVAADGQRSSNAGWFPAPQDLFGHQLWSRPPPFSPQTA